MIPALLILLLGVYLLWAIRRMLRRRRCGGDCAHCGGRCGSFEDPTQP